jgi:hypothetical protein
MSWADRTEAEVDRAIAIVRPEGGAGARPRLRHLAVVVRFCDDLRLMEEGSRPRSIS